MKIQLEILNWEKYNPRKDLKSTHWFRVNNDILEGPDFFEFTHSEIVFWIYLLSLASKRQTGRITLVMAHAQRIGRFKESEINAALEKLIELGCVLVAVQACDVEPNADVTPTLHARDVHVPLRTNERTNVTERTNARPKFDLESVYERYPRKQGKKAGIERLTRSIQTEEELEALNAAVDRFIAHHKAEKTEPQFIPYFSTFVSSWTDWCEANAGEVQNFGKKTGIDWDTVYGDFETAEKEDPREPGGV